MVEFTEKNLYHQIVQNNHPPTTTKQAWKSVNKRLSTLSSNQKVFNEEKPLYEKALKISGHPHNLKYIPPTPNKRTRTRNPI